MHRSQSAILSPRSQEMGLLQTLSKADFETVSNRIHELDPNKMTGETIKAILSTLCKRGDAPLLASVIGLLPDANVRDNKGSTFLHEVASRTYPSLLQKTIFKHSAIQVHVRNNNGVTPLINFIKNVPLIGEEEQYQNMLTTLLLRLVNEEEKNNTKANSPIRSSDSLDFDHPLLWELSERTTLIHLAVDVSNNLALEILLQFGLARDTSTEWANLLHADCVDGKGETGLLRAIRTDKEETCTVLLEYGADPKLKSKNGNAPYHEAQKKNMIQLVSLMDEVINGYTPEKLVDATKTTLQAQTVTRANSIGIDASNIDKEEGLLEFFKTLDRTSEAFNHAILSSSIKQKFNIGRIRDATATLFSSVIEIKKTNSNTQGGLTLPHWPRLFHQLLFYTRSLITCDKIRQYEHLVLDFLKTNTKSPKYLHATLCAQSFYDYLQSHCLDTNNSIIGLPISLSLPVRSDILKQLYLSGKSLGFFKKSSQPVISTAREQSVEIMSNWVEDLSLSADELRNNLRTLLDLYKLEENLQSEWDQVSRLPEPGDILIALDDTCPNIRKEMKHEIDQYIKCRFVRCASKPVGKIVGEESDSNHKNFHKFYIFDRPNESIRKPIDKRMLLPVPPSIISKIREGINLTSYFESIVESPVVALKSQINLLIDETVIDILKDSGADIKLLKICKSPLDFTNESEEFDCRNYMKRLKRLDTQISGIMARLETSKLYNETREKVYKAIEQTKAIITSNGSFIPSKQNELKRLKHIKFERDFDSIVNSLKQQVVYSLIFMETLYRLDFPNNCTKKEQDDVSVEYIWNLGSLAPIWWESLIEIETDKFLLNLNYDFVAEKLALESSTIKSESINKNLKLLNDILSPKDICGVAELEGTIANKLFPMLDYYIRTAYDCLSAHGNTTKDNPTQSRWRSFSLPSQLESCRNAWLDQLKDDIQILLTIKSPPCMIEENTMEAVPCLSELIRRTFVNRRDRLNLLITETENAGQRNSSVLTSSQRRKAKHLPKELRKIFKTNPTLSSISISEMCDTYLSDSQCISQITKWAKEESTLQEPALRFLCLASYPEETSTISRNILKNEGLLPLILGFIRNEEIIFHKEISRDDYQIGNFIAKGSGGVIYECQYKGETAVIKKCTSDGILYTSKEEVRTELALMSILKHPHILSCYGGHLGKSPYILMPRAPFCLESILLGEPSEEKINLPWTIRYKIAYEIALGMDYIHSWKAVHRDLKAANILLNEKFDVFITDFGVSRSTDNRMTLNLGTIFWMAPEMFQGDGTYTNAIDIYSYGVLLWEMAARETPYNELESWAIPTKVVEGLRPTIPKDCPKEFASLIEECWQNNPSLRPTFSEITDKLKSHVDYSQCSHHLLSSKRSVSSIVRIPNRSNSSIGHQRSRPTSTPHNDKLEVNNPMDISDSLKAMKDLPQTRKWAPVSPLRGKTST